MEYLKRPKDLCTADKRQRTFVRLDTGLPVTLDNRYEAISSIVLHQEVPEEIRESFIFAQNMWLYGWFYYPLHSAAIFHALSTLEMALWRRHNMDRDRKGRPTSLESPGLGRLLNEAIQKRWLVDHMIEHARHLHDRRNPWQDIVSKDTQPADKSVSALNDQTQEYCRILAATLPNLRNSAAHPRSLSYQQPSLLDFALVRDLVNQLFVAREAPTEL